jgi:cyclohexyl-isocyanide hydratase
MEIAALIFPNMDQMDFTGPFEVLSRLPNSRVHMVWKNLSPIRDAFGLILTPTATISGDLPVPDVLLIPGGWGQLALMDDEAILSWLRARAAEARYLLSVCTGALTLGAAGLLQGRRATTHWNSVHLLPHFGAIPEDGRVVVDGNLVSTAGVSAGIDGSLRLVAALAGEAAAQRIQLEIEYAPEPPFASGTPAQAPEPILHDAIQAVRKLTAARLEAALRAEARLRSAGSTGS